MLPIGRKPSSSKVAKHSESHDEAKQGQRVHHHHQPTTNDPKRVVVPPIEETPVDTLRIQLQHERASESELDHSIKEAYKQNPTDSSRKFTYAFSLSRSKSRRKRKKSIKLFQELLEQAQLSPSTTAARDIDFYLAKTYYWNEDFNECLECLNRILACEPRNNQIRTFRALLFEDRLCVEGQRQESSNSPRHETGIRVRLTRSGNLLTSNDKLDQRSSSIGVVEMASSTTNSGSGSTSNMLGHVQSGAQCSSGSGVVGSGVRVASGGSGSPVSGSGIGRRRSTRSGPIRQPSDSTFAEAMQDSVEMQDLRRGFLMNVRFLEVLQELNPRFDLAANTARRLLVQWQCFPSEQEVTHEWQQAALQQMPPAKMYLFSDCLIYAVYTPHAARFYEMQRMFPLYRLKAELRELPSKIYQLTLSADATDRPLVSYTQNTGVKQLAEAIQHEQECAPDAQLEMVRVSIPESAALLPLGLSRTHKAIAVTKQTTADMMRKAVIQKMCTALKVHHVQIIATECEDYRIWRVSTETGEEVVFESSDFPLRFLSIDASWALVIKPYPPRKSKTNNVMIDKREEENSSTKAELSEEEHYGVIRVYFSDTPLLIRLEYNSSSFKTLFISSKITTGEVCKILISKLTDNLVSAAERKSTRSQLEQYRLWGLSSDNRRMYLDVASHPWPIFKKACLQDPQFRFVFAPTLTPASETEGNKARTGRALPWMHKMWGSKSASSKNATQSPSSSMPQALKQHLRVDEELTWSGEDPTTSFQIERQIGAGAYGSVFLATHVATGKTLAIKEFFCSTNNEVLSMIESEIAILKQCRHPDIVGYYGSCRKNETDLWVFMDYCEHGSLLQLFKLLPGGCLTEHQAVAVLLPVLKGLEYLHGQNVVHRDIKSGNILINAQGEAKIADFGISKKVNTDASNSVEGTPQFMSPEAVDGKATTTATDIWSLGITLIEMLEGVPPNAEVPPVRAMYMTLYSDPPQMKNSPARSPETISFVTACLQKDTTKRPTATELLSHPLVDPRSAIMDVISGASRSRELSKASSPPTSSSDENRTFDQLRDRSHLPSMTSSIYSNTFSVGLPSQAAGASLQEMEKKIDQMIHKSGSGIVIGLKDQPDDLQSYESELWGTPDIVMPNLLELEEIGENTNCLPVEEEVSDAHESPESSGPTSAVAQSGYEPIEVLSSTTSLYLEEEDIL